jgi:hypothetical protein
MRKLRSFLAVCLVLAAADALRADEIEAIYVKVDKSLEERVTTLNAEAEKQRQERAAKVEETWLRLAKEVAAGVKDKAEADPAELTKKLVEAFRSQGGGQWTIPEEPFPRERPDSPYHLQASRKQLTNSRRQYQAGELYAAAQGVESVMDYPEVDDITKLLDQLLLGLKEKEKRANDARDEAARALLAVQGELLRKADKPAEVDAILRAINDGRAQYERERQRGDGRMTQRFQAATTLAQSWQDYLMAKQNGNFRDAGNALSNILSNDRSGDGLFPRSELLQLKEGLTVKASADPEDGTSQARRLVAEMREIDQVPALVEKVRALGSNVGIRQEVNALAGTHKALMEKQYDRALSGGVELYRKQDFDVVGGRIIVACLPYYLEYEGAMPPAGTPMDTQLDTLIQDAAKEARWSSVYRGLSLKRALRRNSERDQFLEDDLAAVSALLAGYNLARAGEWERAVRSYQTALEKARGVDVVPFIKPELEAVRAAHPAEYAKAQEAQVTPRYPSSMPSRNNPDRDPPKPLPPGPLQPVKDAPAP